MPRKAFSPPEIFIPYQALSNALPPLVMQTVSPHLAQRKEINMYDLARLAREGWQIVITHTDGFYVDVSRWGVSYTGYSEKNISEAVRDLVEKMPDKEIAG